MSANDLSAARDAGRPAGSALRRPTAWLAAIGVVVLLAAAFALSYDGLAALARAGGVSDRLARYYPVVFDAMMVVAFAAIFVLRTARVYVRLLTWLAAIFILALCAAACAVHAAGLEIARRPLAAAVATLPFLLLVLAFRLWLTMLRHIRRGASPRGRARPAPEEPEYAAPEYTHPESPTGPLALPPAAVPVTGPRPAEIGRGSAGTGVRTFSPGTAEAGAPTAAMSPAETSGGGTAADAAGRDVSEAPGAGAVAVGETQYPGGADRGGDEYAEPVARAAALDAAGDRHDEAEPEVTEPALTEPELGEFGEIGDEDEFVADESPLSDPVTDEAEPEAAEQALPHAAEPRTGEPGTDEPVTGDARAVGPDSAEPGGRTRDDLVDYAEPEAAREDEEIDEFAAFEANETDDEVPPPPSGRVRSSPLPPLDWGPGLGGLTGRRRAAPRRGDPENDTP